MNDVLLVGVWDWANTAWRFKRCLEYLGLSVKAFKGHPHKFSYPEEIEIHRGISRTRSIPDFPIMATVHELKSWADNSKIVHMFASCLVDVGVDLTQHKTVVQHSGVTYTLNSEKGNDIFNPIADATIMQFPSLLGRGAVNEHLVIYPVDTQYIRPNYNRKTDKLIIGHWPSNPDTKGTDKVLRVIEHLESSSVASKFEYVGIRESRSIVNGRRKYDHTPWVAHLERVRRCDVLIETIQPWVYEGETPGSYTFIPNGNRQAFGDWGNQALEGAALGKIVITNSCHSALYQREYGDCALRVANDENELENQLAALIESTPDEILFLKQRTRAWAERNHSIESTATRLWDQVYRHLM